MADDTAAHLDATLVARTAEGDQPAFEGLFRRFERPLYAYFLRMVEDRQVAEDLVCETMAAVWKGARGFRGESKVSTWIFGIGHRMAAGALRRRRPTAGLDEVSDLPAGDDVVEAAERSDASARVRRAIGRLTPEHREVVELTFDQGLSYPEIAQIIGVPVNTVKTRMFYARQRLKALLEAAGITDAG